MKPKFGRRVYGFDCNDENQSKNTFGHSDCHPDGLRKRAASPGIIPDRECGRERTGCQLQAGTGVCFRQHAINCTRSDPTDTASCASCGSNSAATRSYYCSTDSDCLSPASATNASSSSDGSTAGSGSDTPASSSRGYASGTGARFCVGKWVLGVERCLGLGSGPLDLSTSAAGGLGGGNLDS